jgi:hypothetical protein
MSPFPCKATEYGFPAKLLVVKPGANISIVGETPTLSEVQAAIAAGDMIVIEELTNGQRTEADRQTEEGADTADGLVNVLGVNMAITGRVKLLDEAVRTDLAKLNCFQRLNVWFITNQAYIFGGKTGYKVANFIPPTIMEGFGVRAYHDINFVYKHNLNQTEPAGYDEGFLALTNPAVS